MSRFSEPNLATAGEVIARYPRPKSATIPLLHHQEINPRADVPWRRP